MFDATLVPPSNGNQSVTSNQLTDEEAEYVKTEFKRRKTNH
jgi:hypothetical protein